MGWALFFLFLGQAWAASQEDLRESRPLDSVNCFIHKVVVSRALKGPIGIHIERGLPWGGSIKTFIRHSDRPIAKLLEFDIYPNRFVDLSPMAGKYVLDLASGYEGLFVKELAASPYKIHAFGVDLAPRRSPTDPARIVAGDAVRLPFKNGSFHFVFSTWSLFTEFYAENEHSQTLITALREVHRVLKVGGVFRVGPDVRPDRIRYLLSQVPGLRIQDEYMDGGEQFSFEIVKYQN